LVATALVTEIHDVPGAFHAGFGKILPARRLPSSHVTTGAPATTADRRDGVLADIPARGVVQGDVFVLEAGDDFYAVKTMHEALSPDNTYLRFFNLSRTAAGTEARRICRVPSPDQVALLALSDGEVAGCASYVTIGERAPGRQSGAAEMAGHRHERRFRRRPGPAPRG
jgi:hypothetical protein